MLQRHMRRPRLFLSQADDDPRPPRLLLLIGHKSASYPLDRLAVGNISTAAGTAGLGRLNSPSGVGVPKPDDERQAENDHPRLTDDLAQQEVETAEGEI